MAQREGVAQVLGPAVVAAILWLPAWVFLAIAATAIVIAGDELLNMARTAGIPSGRWWPLAALLGTLSAAWAFGLMGMSVAALAAVVILPTLQLVAPRRPQGGLEGAATSCFTVLYLGLTGASLGWIRQWPADDLGIGLLLVFLGSIWIGDSGAYYVGRTLGRHRMSPRLSPKKTWEGLAGGTVATFAGAAAMKLLFQVPVAWTQLMVIAAILAVTAPVGDLVESVFKRSAGVKDSSTLLPGHGGFLDRTDSLLYSAPAVLGYLVLSGLA